MIRTKQQQREQALQNRRALTKEQRAEKSRRICGSLCALPELIQAQRVFSYRAVWDEADLDAVNSWAEKEGKQVAYPISLPHGIMKAAVPCGEDAWMRGAYGILTPVEEKSVILKPEQIDIILVPCVAFDWKGNRCGHGAGYYDRYLPRCGSQAALVLVAFDVQEMPLLATESTDVPFSLIVTESGVVRL